MSDFQSRCGNCGYLLNTPCSKVYKILSTWNANFTGIPNEISIPQALSEIFEHIGNNPRLQKQEQEDHNLSRTKNRNILKNVCFCFECAETLTILYNSVKEFIQLCSPDLAVAKFISGFDKRQQSTTVTYGYSRPLQRVKCTQTEHVSNPYVRLRDCLSGPGLLREKRQKNNAPKYGNDRLIRTYSKKVATLGVAPLSKFLPKVSNNEDDENESEIQSDICEKPRRLPSKQKLLNRSTQTEQVSNPYVKLIDCISEQIINQMQSKDNNKCASITATGSRKRKANFQSCVEKLRKFSKTKPMEKQNLDSIQVEVTDDTANIDVTDDCNNMNFANDTDDYPDFSFLQEDASNDGMPYLSLVEHVDPLAELLTPDKKKLSLKTPAVSQQTVQLTPTIKDDSDSDSVSDNDPDFCPTVNDEQSDSEDSNSDRLDDENESNDEQEIITQEGAANDIVAKSDEYLCELCDRSFSTQKEMLEHKSLHMNPIVCSVCHIKYPNVRPNWLKVHVYNKHRDYEPENREEISNNWESECRCLICDLLFRDTSETQSHFEELHYVRTDRSSTFPSDIPPAKKICQPQTVQKEPSSTNLKKFKRHKHKRYDLEKGLTLPNSDGRFPCDKCDLTFLKESFMLSHRYITHIRPARPRHLCPVCPRSFQGPLRVMQTHLLNCHKEYQPERREIISKNWDRSKSYCNICNRWFYTKYSLEKHRINKHHVRIDKPTIGDTAEKHPLVTCKVEGCGKQFAKSNLQYHMQHYHNRKPLRLYPRVKCPLCNKEVLRRWYKRHQKAVHQLEVEVEVDHGDQRKVKRTKPCNSVTTEKTDTETEESFQCTLCDKIYKKLKSLREHERTVHKNKDDALPILCTICGLSFKSKQLCRRHETTVHSNSNETFLCTMCGKSFKSKQLCRRHETTVHSNSNEAFLCTICGKSFKKRASAKVHEEFVHSKKDVAIACSFCGKCFNSTLAVRRHELLVHCSGPFECPFQCGKTYTRKAILKDHIKYTHTEEASKVVCTICGKRINRLPDLKKHMKAIHGVEDPTNSTSAVANVIPQETEETVSDTEDSESDEDFEETDS